MRYLFSLAAAIALAAAPAAAQTPAACCSITDIQAATGVVTAKVTATGNVFQFKAPDPRTLASLRVGQGVFANFTAKQVSLDGRSVCCTITSGPTALAAVPVPAPPAAAPAPRAPAPAPAPPAAAPAAAPAPQAPAPAPAPPPARQIPAPAPSLPDVAAAGQVANVLGPPRLTFGAPTPAPSLLQMMAQVNLQPAMTSNVFASVGGRQVPRRVVRLRGADGVDGAPDILPDGVRRLLQIHVRKLRPSESAYYLVDVELAQEWIKTHPVPPSVKPKKESNNECKGNEFSRAYCEVDHVADNISAELERLRENAEDWWEDARKALEGAKECFEDHTLSGPDIPVQFSRTTSIPLSWSGSTSQGGATGTVTVNVGLGIPMQSDFQAKLDFLYIPCLPFVFRPKSLAADGRLTVGEQLSVDVTAFGAFNKKFDIGGLQIPIYVIPVVINGVPVAEFDVSAWIAGTVTVDAKGKVGGQFAVSNSHRTDFEFGCDGKGCTSGKGGKPPKTTNATTTSESAKIEGQVSVTPALYTALQINFNVRVLGARAGPEPYLVGKAAGCGAASATQPSGGPSTSQQNVALVADLDWGVKFKAEALVGGKVVGKPYLDDLKPQEHLWWKDLAPGGSSGLVAAVSGPSQATVAQPAVYKLRMPTCYPPSTSPVRYRVTWTGSTTPVASPATACQFQAGTGDCTFDPKKDLVLSFTWPQAGPQTLSVLLLGDDHVTYSPRPAAGQIAVTVAAAGGGAP